MSGTKHDQGKPDLTLLDRTAMEEVVVVLGFGEKKYGRYNWKRGIDKERLLAASLRHIMASNDGEKKDPESGRSHLAHAICGLMFALHFELKQENQVITEESNDWLRKIRSGEVSLVNGARVAEEGSLSLKVGKKYRRRDGIIVGPMYFVQNSEGYNYKSYNWGTFTENGRYLLSQESAFDLIEEVEE
jgi:hypothetical protein